MRESPNPHHIPSRGRTITTTRTSRSKTIKVSGVIDRELHAEVVAIARGEGVAFGVIVQVAIEGYCFAVKRHPAILNRLPKDGRISA